MVDFSKESTFHATCLMAKADKGWLWHRRLAHVGMRNLQDLLKGNHILGLTNVSFEKDRVCSACIAGKQHQSKHSPKNIVSTSRPLELLHVDLFGPPSWDSLGGKKYGLVIVDDYSRYTWVFFLKSKDETKITFIDFSKQAQHKFDKEILAIRSDNGSEFKNYTLEELLSDEGIEHQYSAPYTPQQNGVAERKNRTLVEMARSMLDEYKSPHSFWAEAVNTACHASNRLFLRTILEKTPYELLSGNKPNVKYFRVFGCKCFILNKRERLGKFQSKTIEGIFVGYGSNSHAYRVYNKSNGCVVETCDVVFDEFNGSHGEQVDLSDVGEEDSSQDILTMGVGALLPMEQEPHDDEEEDERRSPHRYTPRFTDYCSSSSSSSGSTRKNRLDELSSRLRSHCACVLQSDRCQQAKRLKSKRLCLALIKAAREHSFGAVVSILGLHRQPLTRPKVSFLRTEPVSARKKVERRARRRQCLTQAAAIDTSLRMSTKNSSINVQQSSQGDSAALSLPSICRMMTHYVLSIANE